MAVFADMVKLADTLDLGSSIERCAGSNPVIRTKGLEFRLKHDKKNSLTSSTKMLVIFILGVIVLSIKTFLVMRSRFGSSAVVIPTIST